jgi:hypothetical protein
MRLIVVLLLALVILGSGFLLDRQPVAAQYSPPVPAFTLKFDNESYNVSPTGTTPGYYVDNEFIDVIIKNTNQYSFYAVVNSSLVKLYYNIRVKDHSQNWANCYVSPNLAPSNSNYTTVKFGLGSVNPDPDGSSIWIGNITNGNQVDFQVRGVDGFYTKLTQQDPTCWRLSQYSVFNETGASSWSPTQTMDRPENPISTPTQTPLAANDISPLTLIVSTVTAVVAVSAGALAAIKRHRKQKSLGLSSEVE